MENELISVIVPVYNVEPYLKECLDSIINQTYKNLEIILIDDGSLDNCGKICDEYAKKDNRIKVIHKENGGLSSARNAGLDIAEGEYISFIDSDDYVAENFIETLYKLCVENDCDISECDFLKFENDVVIQEKITEIQCYTSNEVQHKIYSEEYVKTIVVWNKLYKKYLYENMRFPLGKINEDEFITYKVLYNCKSNIAVTNEQLYYYRYNAQSIMGRKFNERRLDVLEAFEERKQFYKDRNEVELYNKTVAQYQQILISFYGLAKENIENDNEILKSIKNKARKNYNEYRTNKSINTVDKVKALLFDISPTTLLVLLKIKKKLTQYCINILNKIKGGKNKIDNESRIY